MKKETSFKIGAVCGITGLFTAITLVSANLYNLGNAAYDKVNGDQPSPQEIVQPSPISPKTPHESLPSSELHK